MHIKEQPSKTMSVLEKPLLAGNECCLNPILPVTLTKVHTSPSLFSERDARRKGKEKALREIQSGRPQSGVRQRIVSRGIKDDTRSNDLARDEDLGSV
ncbi:hypothetical protein CDAR_210441 [Caerostris darwini]|uniref:Uncharacterized protein n=1 Tax=Caerostris darwini TaxID=1538125 RepID=A0AAV4MJY7_9ARAC|nr:hypothetical protein CDAR_210441 [Caerostris darwini]